MIDCTKCIRYDKCIKDEDYMAECSRRDWDGYVEIKQEEDKDD